MPALARVGPVYLSTPLDSPTARFGPFHQPFAVRLDKDKRESNCLRARNHRARFHRRALHPAAEGAVRARGTLREDLAGAASEARRDFGARPIEAPHKLSCG